MGLGAINGETVLCPSLLNDVQRPLSGVFPADNADVIKVGNDHCGGVELMDLIQCMLTLGLCGKGEPSRRQDTPLVKAAFGRDWVPSRVFVLPQMLRCFSIPVL